jgi:hypothetical protein
VFSIL